MVEEEETVHSFNELQKEIERQLEEKANHKRARKRTQGTFFRIFCVLELVCFDLKCDISPSFYGYIGCSKLTSFFI
jgi:hypothetical protein